MSPSIPLGCTSAKPEGGAFILPSVGRSPSAPMPPCQTHTNVRKRASQAQTGHCGLRFGDLRTTIAV